VRGRYEIHYFGARQPRVKTITVLDGGRAFIDVIDTWEMTIDTLPGTHEGVVAVPLPAKPYMAIRVRRTEKASHPASASPKILTASPAARPRR
jgi:hypothetical protein